MIRCTTARRSRRLGRWRLNTQIAYDSVRPSRRVSSVFCPRNYLHQSIPMINSLIAILAGFIGLGEAFWFQLNDGTANPVKNGHAAIHSRFIQKAITTRTIVDTIDRWLLEQLIQFMNANDQVS